MNEIRRMNEGPRDLFLPGLLFVRRVTSEFYCACLDTWILRFSRFVKPDLP